MSTVVAESKHLQTLINGCKELNIQLSTEMENKLFNYVKILLKWNKTYSLTAITDLDEIIKYHILDGLTVVNFLNSQLTQFTNIVDVGSGMGVPGIILAIYYSNKQVTLVDGNNKKSIFLKQVAIELNLTNVVVVNSRVENYIPVVKFDIIISRAFARLNLFIQLTKHLCSKSGYFIAMKSKNVEQELDIQDNYAIRVNETKIPYVVDKRFLVKICYE